jgi:hypothetical protein
MVQDMELIVMASVREQGIRKCGINSIGGRDEWVAAKWVGSKKWVSSKKWAKAS